MDALQGTTGGHSPELPFGVFQPELPCGVGACQACLVGLRGNTVRTICQDGPAIDLKTAPAVMTLRSAVCFFAHPDDETILAGGIITLLARQGVLAQVVCATRGEGGEVGDPPVVPDPELLGAAREAELRCAVHTLGASVTVLDSYTDLTVGEGEALYPFAVAFDTLAAQFGEIADHYQADLVLTHGADGEYGHPAHQLVHRAVLAELPVALPETLIYTVAARVPSIEDRLWN